MLNPARQERRGGKYGETRKLLEAAGVNVNDSNPKFGLTHEKSMVIDGENAFVKSLELGNEKSDGNKRLRYYHQPSNTRWMK